MASMSLLNSILAQQHFACIEFNYDFTDETATSTRDLRFKNMEGYADVWGVLAQTSPDISVTKDSWALPTYLLTLYDAGSRYRIPTFLMKMLRVLRIRMGHMTHFAHDLV